MPRKNSITTRSSRSKTRKTPVANSKAHNKEDEKRKTRQSLHKSSQIELSPFSLHPQSIPSPSLFTRSKIQKGQSPPVIYIPTSNDRLTRSKEKGQRKSSDNETHKKLSTTPTSLRSKRNSRGGDETEDKPKIESPRELRLTRSGKRTRSSNEQFVSIDDSDTPAKRRRTRSSHGSPLLSDSFKTSSSRKSTNSESPLKKPSPTKSAKRTPTRRSGTTKTKTVRSLQGESDEEEEEEEEESDYNANVNKSDKKGKSQSSVLSSKKKTPKSAVNDKKLVKNVKSVKKSPVKVKSKAKRKSTPVSSKKDTSQMSSSLSRTRSRSRGHHEKPVNDLKLTPHVTKGRRSTQRSEPSHRESSGQRQSTPSRNTRRAQKPQKSKKMPPDQPSRQSKDEEERMEEGSSAEQEASEDGTKSIDMEAEEETKTAPEKEQHVDEDGTKNEKSNEMEEDKEVSNKRKRSDDDSAENIPHEIKKPKLEQEESKAADDTQEAESESAQNEKTESPVENVVDSVIKSVEKMDSRASVITSSTSSSDVVSKDAEAVQDKEKECEETPSVPEPKEPAAEKAKEGKTASADNKPEIDSQEEEPVKMPDEQVAGKSIIEQTLAQELSKVEKKETVSVEDQQKESANETDDKEITKERSVGVIEPNCISKKTEKDENDAVLSASTEKESKDQPKDDSSTSQTIENEQEEKIPSDASKSASTEEPVDTEADKSQGSTLGQDQGSSEMDAELRLSETNSSASHSELETSLEKGDDSSLAPMKENSNSSDQPAKDLMETKAEEKPPASPTTLMSTSDSKESPSEAMDVDVETEEKPSAESESNKMEVEVDVVDSNTSNSDAVKIVPDVTSNKTVSDEKESEVTGSCTKETKTESEQIPDSDSNSRLPSDKDSSEKSAEPQPANPTSSTIPPNKEAASTSNEKSTEEANSAVSNSIEQNSEDHTASDDAVIKQASDAKIADNSTKQEAVENKSESAGISTETSEEQVKETVSPKVSENENLEQNGAQSETCDTNEIGANSQNPPVSETAEEHKAVDHVNSPKSNGVSVESVELDLLSATAGKTLTRKYVYNSLLDSQTVEAANEKKFAVVSYNLQGLEGIKTNHENLLNELKQLEPSILCVQDVDAPYFEDTLQPSLKGLGYSGIYRKNKVAEKGLATMYLTSVFEALDHNALDVHDLVQKDIENSGLEGNEKEALSSYLDHSLFVLYTKLRSLSSQKCICVCNASFPAEDLSLHALQIAVTVRELTNQSEGSGNPHILCGTFNMEDSCPGYQILKDGYLSNEMIEDLQGRKNVPIPNKENAALVNLLWKCFQHPSSNLKSSYNIVVGDDTNTSRNLQSSKDSVWFSSDSLHLLGVLDSSELTSETNKNVHLSLKAHFSFVN